MNMCRLLVHSKGCDTYYAFRYEKPFKYGRPRVLPTKLTLNSKSQRVILHSILRCGTTIVMLSYNADTKF